jgi:hypothetical protein
VLFEPSKAAVQEGGGVFLAFAGEQLCVGQARTVIDGDVKILPSKATTDGSPIALAAAIAGDAVAEFLDVDMDQLVRRPPLVALDGQPAGAWL